MNLGLVVVGVFLFRLNKDVVVAVASMNSIFPISQNFTVLPETFQPSLFSLSSFFPPFLSFNQRTQAYIKLQQKKVLGYAAYKQTAELLLCTIPEAVL